MLHKYRFKNFFSFVSETEVSFLLNHQVPATDLVFESPGGARLSKVVAAIGPNASGKTNVLKPLAFLSWFVAHSFTASKPEDEIPIQPHFFSDDKDSEFEIEFENQGQHYRYSLIINPLRVVHESLHLKTSKFFSFIFRRDWSEQDSAYEIRQQKFGFAAGEAAKVRPNASLIATAAQYNVPCASALVGYFAKFYTNVNYSGRDHFKTSDVFEATEFFHGRPALRAQMSELLSRLDLGLSEVIIESHKFVERESGKSEEANIPLGVHRMGDQVQKLPFWYESSGTQAAFVLLEKILPALEHGGIVIIDEMEADLHPEMITSMLDLFIDRDHNPHNAQIIFTCHAHEVLNDLQKDQVLLIEKDPDGFSEAWRLGDMKGIRRDDNLYAKYRAGAYGAVPNL
jgi:hypothetical protein